MNPSEAEAIESELSPPFNVARPGELTAPLVFNSPHSGRIYPSAFLASSKLDALTLRRSEDAYVEELLGFVSALGAPLLYAHFPRAYLEIYREPLSLVAALERINRLYTPYHDTLKALLTEARQAFGLAVLVDCHSMPSNPISDQGGARSDFVLGDRYGTSCSAELTGAAAQALKAQGYVVALNKPYAD